MLLRERLRCRLSRRLPPHRSMFDTSRCRLMPPPQDVTPVDACRRRCRHSASRYTAPRDTLPSRHA
jgi:hypothetical protein